MLFLLCVAYYEMCPETLLGLILWGVFSEKGRWHPLKEGRLHTPRGRRKLERGD